MALDVPALRRYNLTNNSSRYDWNRAAPSDIELSISWLLWAAVSGFVALVCISLILSILRSSQTRQKPFNLYIVFLTIPNAFFSAMCTITCVQNFTAGHYASPTICEWQSFYCIFGFTANMWMNAVVMRQIHKLLRESNEGRSYHPPTRERVYYHAAVVYAYAAFVASWTLIDLLPHHANAMGGSACLPVEYNVRSTIFFWCAFIPSMIGFPFIYILYVYYDVKKKNILPANGRTREITLFFSGIVATFVIMWLPTVILIFVVAMRSYWSSIIGGFISHCQGLLSSAICFGKPDIRQAVIEFVSCLICKKDASKNDKLRESEGIEDELNHSIRSQRGSKIINFSIADLESKRVERKGEIEQNKMAINEKGPEFDAFIYILPCKNRTGSCNKIATKKGAIINSSLQPLKRDLEKIHHGGI